MGSWGPSSISLMTAVVNILDRESHNGSDLTGTMKLIAVLLPEEFNRGVESPDDTDENHCSLRKVTITCTIELSLKLWKVCTVFYLPLSNQKVGKKRYVKSTKHLVNV